jgi:hypothetical protein
MTHPFQPTGKTVSVGPETIWRRTNEIIEGPWPDGMRTYFMTNYVAKWSKDEKSREEYERVYGKDKLADVDQFGICEENTNADQVAGTIQGEIPELEEGKSQCVKGGVRVAFSGPPMSYDDLQGKIGEVVADIVKLAKAFETLVSEAELDESKPKPN